MKPRTRGHCLNKGHFHYYFTRQEGLVSARGGKRRQGGDEAPQHIEGAHQRHHQEGSARTSAPYELESVGDPRQGPEGLQLLCGWLEGKRPGRETTRERGENEEERRSQSPREPSKPNGSIGTAPEEPRPVTQSRFSFSKRVRVPKAR